VNFFQLVFPCLLQTNDNFSHDSAGLASIFLENYSQPAHHLKNGDSAGLKISVCACKQTD
jgi:hypothetical protein